MRGPSLTTRELLNPRAIRRIKGRRRNAKREGGKTISGPSCGNYRRPPLHPTTTSGFPSTVRREEAFEAAMHRHFSALPGISVIGFWLKRREQRVRQPCLWWRASQNGDDAGHMVELVVLSSNNWGVIEYCTWIGAGPSPALPRSTGGGREKNPHPGPLPEYMERE